MLFEDGDVPGERMFGFNSKQRKSITNKISDLKAPTCKNKITKRDKIDQCSRQDYSNFNSQGILLHGVIFGYCINI